MKFVKESIYSVFMKIEGSGKTSSTRGASKTGGAKKTGDTSFSGMLEEEGGVEAEKPVSGVASVGRLDALLALQEAGDSTAESRRKAKKRGAALLDELDQVRIGLLTGGIPKDTLQHLTHMVSQHREDVMDPKLASLLDEIDLRVQVELAKHGK